MNIVERKIKIKGQNYFKMNEINQFSYDSIINYLIEKHIRDINFEELKIIENEFQTEPIKKILVTRKSNKEERQKNILGFYLGHNRNIEKTLNNFKITYNQLSYIIRKYQEKTTTELIEKRNIEIYKEYIKAFDKRKIKKILIEKHNISRTQLNRILLKNKRPLT